MPKHPVHHFAIFLWLTLLAVVALASCGEKKPFEVNGEIEGLGTQNLYIIYYDGNGVNRLTVTAIDSKFEFTGNSTEETVVEVYGNSLNPIGRFAARNGDKITVTMKQGDPLWLAAKGNKTSEALTQFLADSTSSGSDLAAAIERHVKAHPADNLSAILVAYYFDLWSDPAKARKLISTLDHKSISPLIMPGVAELLERADPQPGKIEALTLPCKGDTLATAKPAKRGLTLYLFDNSQKIDSDTRQKIDSIAKHTPRKLAMTHLRTTTDTFGWARSIAQLPDGTLSLWASGGASTPALEAFALPTLPYYVVTDSTGTQLLRTPDLDEAATYILSPQKTATKAKNTKKKQQIKS